MLGAVSTNKDASNARERQQWRRIIKCWHRLTMSG
jgi:hypothetical protein